MTSLLICCALAGVVLLITSFLALQAVAACAWGAEQSRSEEAFRQTRGKCVVIIPAHNEASGIADALNSISMQKAKNDLVLVVADNCSDDTADVARSMGALVVDRCDPDRVGKGYAISCGFEYIRHFCSPHDVVIFLDADCTLSDCAIKDLVIAAALSAGPVQGCYLMRYRDGQSLEHRISTFAWNVRNGLRGAGSAALGIPAQITGSGFAAKVSVCKELVFGGGHLAEDLNMGVEAALRGQPAEFVPSAKIYSVLAANKHALHRQQMRWQQGHRSVFARSTSRLLGAAFKKRSPNMALMALDLAVPPLGLLFALVCLSSGVSLLLWFQTGVIIPATVAAFSLSFLCVFVFCAARFGDLPEVSVIEILWLPGIVLGKSARTVGNLFAKRMRWLRTDRG